MPPEHSRRSALILGATLSTLSLAGCTSSERHIDTTTRSPSALSVGDSAIVGGGAITIDSIQPRQMFVGLKAGVHPEVYGRPDTQYVIVDVLTDGVAKPTRTVRSALSLSLDSSRYDVDETFLTRNRTEENAVSVAFAVPTFATATAGQLLWDGRTSSPDAAWTLPQAVLDVLAAPPELTVSAFEVPNKAAQHSSIEPAITVRNSGENSGTFVAELGSTQLSDQSEIRFDVPAGGRETHIEPVSLYGSAGSDETIILDWGEEMLERTLHIESETEG